ncbi:uncharacterized protein LOC141661767 [Apium graveolens]|uniref:uncharacterized protein LOC141661767 n=1 Tax=Apium graveolens TaxID=4045 RepID=UPI003D7A00AE
MATPSQIQETDQDPPSIHQRNSPQIENPISNLEEITHQNDLQTPKTLEMSIIQDPERSDPTVEETLAILDVDVHEDEFVGNVSSPTTKMHNRRQVYKRRKPGELKRQKTIDKKVENLLKYVNFVPFMPVKTLDFDKYEDLLKNLGLWDFVRLKFDDEVKADVIAQFIVSYDNGKRCGFVNGSRIYMSRRGFVTAFKLPVPKPKNKKEKVVGSAVEEAIDLDVEGELMSDDCIKFLEDFVWTWVVLRGDDWAMPNEIKNWMGLIRDGHPERVDWGGLFLSMVENELKQKDQLQKCYYASHLQYFMKSQRKELFGEEGKKSLPNEGIKEEGKLLNEEEIKQAEVEEIKSQRKELFEEEVVKAVANEGIDEAKLLSIEDNKEVEEIKKDEDLLEESHKVDQKVAEERGVVSESHHGVELMEKVKDGPNGAVVEEVKEDTDIEEDNVVLEGPNIELALGQQDLAEREMISGVNVMDAEKCKVKKQVSWCLSGSDHGGKPLRPCILGEGRGLDGNDEGKEEVEQLQMEEEEQQMEGQQYIQEGGQMEDAEHIQRGKQLEEVEQSRGWEEAEDADNVDEVEVDELEVDDTDEQVEVEDEEADDEELEDVMEHNSLPAYGSPGAAGLPGDLLQTFETGQMPLNLQGQQIHENSSMELFSSNAETHLMMGGPSMYGNGHKRAIDYEQDTSHLNGSKRIRTDVGWDQKTSDFGFCMGQAAQLMEKAKIMYVEKEQAYNEINMNQQYLLREVQQRDNYIESLQRNNHEVVQKKDAEIYRLERELGMLVELVNGYREALKENRRSFLEYRQRCQLPEEPIYKDAGPGGLVLSVTELEKLRQQHENEDRLKRTMIKQKFTEAFEGYSNQFEVLLSRVQMIDKDRLTPIENEVKVLKELYSAKRVTLEKDTVPTEIVAVEKEDMVPTSC